MKEEGDIDEEFLAADFSTINEEGDIDEEFLAAEWTQSEVMREVSGSGVEPSCRVDHQCMRYIGGYLTYKVIIIRYTLTLTIHCIHSSSYSHLTNR